MGERKDYYAILGITESEKKLSEEDFAKVVNKKFRKIALSCHPDRQGGKSEAEKKQAEEKFKEAAEAKEVLSDSKKRAEYDNPASHFQFNGGGFSQEDMDNFFKQFHFGNESPFGKKDPFNSFFSQEDIVRTGSDIVITQHISILESINGVSKQIKYQCLAPCENCHGTGRTKDTVEEACPYCHGTGRITQTNGIMIMSSTCPHCHGTGRTLKNCCKECNGTGVKKKEKILNVRIPKGVRSEMMINVQGQGNAIKDGNNGNLIIKIIIDNDKQFSINNDDLITSININPIEAILGCKKKIKTIEGKEIEIDIPKGSNNYSEIVIPNEGMTNNVSQSRGNLIAKINIVISAEINKKEISLLKELQKQEHFSN